MELSNLKGLGWCDEILKRESHIVYSKTSENTDELLILGTELEFVLKCPGRLESGEKCSKQWKRPFTKEGEVKIKAAFVSHCKSNHVGLKGKLGKRKIQESAQETKSSLNSSFVPLSIPTKLVVPVIPSSFVEQSDTNFLSLSTTQTSSTSSRLIENNFSSPTSALSQIQESFSISSGISSSSIEYSSRYQVFSSGDVNNLSLNEFLVKNESNWLQAGVIVVDLKISFDESQSLESILCNRLEDKVLVYQQNLKGISGFYEIYSIKRKSTLKSYLKKKTGSNNPVLTQFEDLKQRDPPPTFYITDWEFDVLEYLEWPSSVHHSWRNPQSELVELLVEKDNEHPGISSPFSYLGKDGSPFTLHEEDDSFPSINILLFGK